MEIRHINFKHQLILIIDNKKIHITPFLTEEPGTIKFGIDAPYGLSVNREEIYKSKKARLELGDLSKNTVNYSKKIQEVFTELVQITNKSEKLKAAAKQLFNKDKILTPKTLDNIARGESSTSLWLVTCAIDVLINEKPKSLKHVLSADELHHFWSKPLLKRTADNTIILEKAHRLDCPGLIEQILKFSSPLK